MKYDFCKHYEKQMTGVETMIFHWFSYKTRESTRTHHAEMTEIVNNEISKYVRNEALRTRIIDCVTEFLVKSTQDLEREMIGIERSRTMNNVTVTLETTYNACLDSLACDLSIVCVKNTNKEKFIQNMWIR